MLVLIIYWVFLIFVVIWNVAPYAILFRLFQKGHGERWAVSVLFCTSLVTTTLGLWGLAQALSHKSALSGLPFLVMPFILLCIVGIGGALARLDS